jgi:hypothetical protein
MSSGGRRPPPIGPRVLVNNHHHHDSGSGSGENSKRDGAARDDGHRNTDRDNRYTSSSSYSSSKDREHGYRPPDTTQTRQAPQTRRTITRAQPHTTRVLLHQMHQLSSGTTNVSSCAPPPIFSANFSDAFFRRAALSRHHTANSTRTIANSRMATSRGGT